MAGRDVVDGDAVEYRLCAECGTQYVVRAPHQRLCGRRACSKKSERRRARTREGGGLQQRPEFKALTRPQVENAVAEVVRDELKPIVREALTEDVLRSIHDLTELLPQAVQALKADLENVEDPELRHKAAALVMKLTVQNNSVAPPSLEQTPAPLQVHFGVPRPGQVQPSAEPAPEVEDAEVVEEPERECMECHMVKPADEFVGTSDRCQVCDEALRAEVVARFGPVKTPTHTG